MPRRVRRDAVEAVGLEVGAAAATWAAHLDAQGRGGGRQVGADPAAGRQGGPGKQLLGSTDWSIARVIEVVGYSDAASFARLFSRRVGETPARYRRR